MTSSELQHVVGRRLREKRQALNISQQQLADDLGVHRTYVGSIERGERNLSLASLEHIAETLGLRVRDLLDF